MDFKKKVIGIVCVIIIVLGVIIYTIYNNKQEDMEKIIKEPAFDYYVNYMNANSGSSAYKVTLKMLKEADKYDLSDLDKCDENNTYAVINISFADGSLKDTDVVLDCKMF